ncbi:cysteate racemase [Gudongella sp. SC589]|uniref:aspartate/glutamate racemase family protein n=1 Tax=Gudongella sp. SC589 TaxID=3385990 RepID=UPI003904D0B9
MKKTIGIIGGMGPLATAKLFEKIVLYTKADLDQDHPHTIIDSNTKIPDRTSYILQGGESPMEELTKSVKRLKEAGADFLVMPCNTAHYFYDELKSAADIPFINMISETVSTIKKDFPGMKVGLLSTSGTISSGVYSSELEKQGIEYAIPTGAQQDAVMDLIYNIKKGMYDNDLKGFNKAIGELKDQGSKVIILGCTELSVAYDMYGLPEEVSYVDALRVLAREAVIQSGCDINT